MNKKGFIDLDMDFETLIALGLGIFTGFISLFVMNGYGNSYDVGWFWKIMTFVVSSIAGFLAIKFIGSR